MKTKNGAVIPQYQSEGAAGFDIHSNVEEIIPAGRCEAIGTGLFVEIPDGYEMQIRPRSGLALKTYITVLNAPGTIDSDYRGEIKIILMNFGKTVFHISKGDRIAQGVISKVWKADFKKQKLTKTVRGKDGFGSTGSK